MVKGQGVMHEVCRGLAGEISFEESIRRQTNILEYEIMQAIKEKLEGYINEIPYGREGKLQEED
jgi:hypothetical protein